VRGSQRAAAQFVAEVLDADADEGGQRPRSGAECDLLGGGCGVAVFLGVRPVAVTIFEVEAEVLDRLAREFFPDPRVDAAGRGCGKVQGGGECGRVRRELVENA
jgi:hypothetical protein